MRTQKRAATAALLLAAASAHAQVVTDGSVGARVTLSGRNMVITESLGQRVGTNLLHSFSTFNVNAGETATFAGSPGFLSNIIARITGGAASRIDGTLASTVPSNLFLVNPSGIVFGPGAAINVNGSFHASTAHYVKLADGTRIATNAAADVTLTLAPPSAFGFEGAAAPIALQGAQLAVAQGRNLSLSGGDISMEQAPGRVSSLSAPSGTIGIAATRSAGEAVLDPGGLRAEGFGAMGALAVRDSVIRVNEGAARGGAGAISLAGGDVTLSHANVESRTAFAAGRGIAVNATGALLVDASNVVSVTTGAGDAGPLTLEARNMTISGASLVDTSCDSGCTTGRGGALTLRANGTLRIEGAHPVDTTYVVSNSFGGGRTGAIDLTAGRLEIDGNAFLQGVAVGNGNGSTLTVRAGEVLLRNGGQIDGGVHGTGQGGRVTVTATGGIRIEGVRQNQNPRPSPGEPPFFPSGIFSSTLRGGAGGDIVVSARTLDIVDGGRISGAAGSLGVSGTGTGGSVTIEAAERITVRGFGISEANNSSGIFADTYGSGAAGTIVISAPLLEVIDSGKVLAQTDGSGNSGAIRIAGRDLRVANRGQIGTTTSRDGAGGNVAIALDGTLTVAGSGSGIFANAEGRGPGGSVDIVTRNAMVEDQSRVAALSSAEGAGGAVRLGVTDTLVLRDGASITAQTVGTGRGGIVDVRAGSMDLSGQASITTETRSSGDAGAIRVEARDGIVMTGGASISSESVRTTGLAGPVTVIAGDLLALSGGARITTAARSADGGDILVSASRAMLDAARITTEVGTGQGGGGNMDIRVPTLVLRDSVISANAFGGPGGNIHIGTSTFIPSATSSVTASSQLGIDGTITFDSPALDPTGELLLPPPTFLDAGAILAGRCGPRLAGRASSLVVVPGAYDAAAPDAWRLAQWSRPLACMIAAWQS